MMSVNVVVEIDLTNHEIDRHGLVSINDAQKAQRAFQDAIAFVPPGIEIVVRAGAFPAWAASDKETLQRLVDEHPVRVEAHSHRAREWHELFHRTPDEEDL